VSAYREIDVRREGRRAAGRLEAGVARLLVPRGEDLEEIVVPEDALPDALARLLDLGPRPVSPAATPVRTSVEALAAALEPAGWEPAQPPGGGSAEDHEAIQGLLAAGHVHWRVEVREGPSSGAPHALDLEVLDTGVGLWLVQYDEAEVELSPATATAVFRRLAALVSGH